MTIWTWQLHDKNSKVLSLENSKEYGGMNFPYETNPDDIVENDLLPNHPQWNNDDKVVLMRGDDKPRNTFLYLVGFWRK